MNSTNTNTLTFNDELFKVIYINDTKTNYAVSNTGRVVNYKRQKELRTRIHHSGYVYVDLNVNSCRYTKQVHRLVAQAFIPNPMNLETVNHIDGIKTHNNVTNLEWMTREDNTRIAHEKTYTLRTPTLEVITVCNLAKFCKENNLNQSALLLVLKGKFKQHKGYTKP